MGISHFTQEKGSLAATNTGTSTISMTDYIGTNCTGMWECFIEDLKGA